MLWRSRPLLAILALALLGTIGLARQQTGTPVDSVKTAERTVTKVADGVYVIRHKDSPGGYVQGNSTVIIGGREVLVVDSCYLIASAREDIADIRTWTDKPVRYLVNTHWHPDHQRANGAYVEAFPAVTIVAQAETPALWEGFDGPNVTRLRQRVATLKQTLDAGKGDDGKPFTDAEKAEMNTGLADQLQMVDDVEKYGPRYPTLTFDHEMTIDIGNRVVQIMCPGRGHTVADAVVYLPKEKVLVTGDLLAYPVPYFFAGYPFDSIGTLERLAALESKVIVPGHGKILYDKAYLNQVINLLQTVDAQVRKEVFARGSLSAKLEDVQKAIDLSAFKRRFAGDDKDNGEFFDASMEGLIRGSFNQLPK
jgi:cyclase